MNNQRPLLSLFNLFFGLAIFSFATITPAVAQPPVLLVEVQNVNLPAGSAGFVDVLISATADQPLSLYGAEFRITPDIASTSTLRFLEETEDYLANPNYVFFGNSAAQNDGFPSSAGIVFTDTDPDDSFLVGDGTDDFSNVIVGASQQLMARLQVKHDLNGVFVADKFFIDLIPVAGTSEEFLFFGTSDTGFVSFEFDPILLDLPVPFQSISGMVTITEPPPPPATPEPATMAHALIALLGILLCRRIGGRAG